MWSGWHNVFYESLWPSLLRSVKPGSIPEASTRFHNAKLTHLSTTIVAFGWRGLSFEQFLSPLQHNWSQLSDMHEFLHKIFMAHEYNITQYTISSPLFPASWYYPHIFPRLHKSKRSLGRCWPFHTDRVWYIGSSSIKGTGLVNGFLDAMKKARAFISFFVQSISNWSWFGWVFGT